MPKKRDAAIEPHILNAAYNLLEKGGEAALTMRAVAKAAGTTTPTVYHRFKDKRDLAEAVRRRGIEKVVAFLTPTRTPEETCSRLLEFAVANRNLYRLITADWAVRLGRKDPKPSFDIIKARLAERLGGSPDDHWDLAMALGAIVHGTASVLLAEGVDDAIRDRLRQTCADGCAALIEHAEHARAAVRK